MAGPCWEEESRKEGWAWEGRKEFLLCYSLNVARANLGTRLHEAALCKVSAPEFSPLSVPWGQNSSYLNSPVPSEGRRKAPAPWTKNILFSRKSCYSKKIRYF